MATLPTPLLPPGGPAFPPIVVMRPQTHTRPAPSQREHMIVRAARERFRMVEDHERAWREHYRYDSAFAAGQQWDETVATARRNAPGGSRVVLTLNQIPKFERIVENDERQNRPMIKVSGVDNGADRHTASALQRLLRHIEHDSDADDAYDTAFACVVRGGKGYWRLLTEYESPWSFRQVIKIQRIMSPLTVYLDPAGRRDVDYHTARFGFVVERQSKQQVQDKYEIDSSTWGAWLTQHSAWVTQDECLLADYYCQEEQPVTLAQLESGAIRYIPLLTETDDPVEHQRQQELLGVVTRRLMLHGVFPLQPDEEGQIARQAGRTLVRESAIPIIWWYKTNGFAILEQTIWPGQFIPIIPVLGSEYEEDGKVDYQGIVRPGIGPQQLFNYARSMAAETIALAPKAPYIGAEGQFRGHEHQWNTLNTHNWSYVEYTPIDLHGSPVPPPQRLVQEPAIAAVTAFAQQAAQDLNETMGIYQAALGAPSPERSGVAIQRRKAQSQLGTAHLAMNMLRARRYSARQIIDLIPFIYHEPGRVVRIIGEDNSESMIQLQPGLPQPHLQSTPEQPLPPGITGIYDLSAGRYDVVLHAGPNYQTKREENLDVLLQLTQSVPTIGPMVADYIVNAVDFDDREAAVRRLRKTLPPELLENESQRPEDQVVILQNQMKELQGLVEQAKLQMQQLNAYAQKLEDDAKQVTQENQHLKIRLEGKGGDLVLEERKLQLEERALTLQERQAAFKQELELRKLAMHEQHFQQQMEAREEDAQHREAPHPREDNDV